ncbi:hypothetical protein EDE04_1865 [Streptomyces sp. 2132.2]|uniref:hypothetical protein n=1 Tax=Streptomyces sp. 2132.2 TaxID=2485161 RepID=UPI000C6B35AA|nr:hypothetical protein EDE04_1865 [Streptomyces sp. 2132.2]
MRRSLRIPPVLGIPPVTALAVAMGALWWWAVLRLALAPGEAGPVEGAVAVGGWGLGLLPVHCTPGPLRRARRAAAEPVGGAEAEPAGGVPVDEPLTRASTPRRSGAGSGRS